MSASRTQPALEKQPDVSGYRIVNRILDWVTNDKTQLLNITERVNEAVSKSGVTNGLVHLQSLHTTTAVFLSEWQDALLKDMERFLEESVEADKYYRHNDPELSDCERMNAHSHLRGMLMGQALCLQVRNAKVLLGTWQSIVLVDPNRDNPHRTVRLSFIEG